ncbi:UDP-D-xylose:L-fucose alpha-1 3-D-xylosyltransferase MGP4 [Bienertia sinuspersici]
MAASLHQRPAQSLLSNPSPHSPRFSLSKRPSSLLTRTNLLLLFSLLIILGFLYPYLGISQSLFSNTHFKFQSKWRNYSLEEAVSFVGQNGTVIVCIVSEPYLDFLNNWLISVTRQKHQDKVLVIAEDYNTLYRVNERWPGHAVLIPPVLESHSAHKFGSLGFFNFTARRPRHLLNILELGYSVMYNDVDMVWLKDPFTYLDGNHDVYFMDDVAAVKPLNHSHALPPPGKKGRPYVCSCMIFLRPTSGAKLAMTKWIEELQEQPWTRARKANDQPAFNWALMKIEKQVDMYLLPQSAFPTGGLYFKNKTWVRETKGSHVIIHNNYILGFEKKIKRFRDYGLWLVDDYASESPLGKL